MELKIAWYSFQAFCIACGGWVGWYVGGLDRFFYTLLIFTIIDYTTGVLAAAATKQLSSKVGFIGIARKLTIFLLVGIANLLDICLLREGSALRVATIFFYLTNEGISLLENTTRLGLPVPPPIANALRLIGSKHNLSNHPHSEISIASRDYQPGHSTNTANKDIQMSTTPKSDRLITWRSRHRPCPLATQCIYLKHMKANER